MKWVLEQACSQQSGEPPTDVPGCRQGYCYSLHILLWTSSCSWLAALLPVLLTSLTLSFVYAGGESHPKQQRDAGLVKKIPRELSPEERKRFAQVDKSVHPQPFAQENQRRCPAAVAGEAGTASCEEAQGLGTS